MKEIISLCIFFLYIAADMIFLLKHQHFYNEQEEKQDVTRNFSECLYI